MSETPRILHEELEVEISDDETRPAQSLTLRTRWHERGELPRVDYEELGWPLLDEGDYRLYWKDQLFTGIAVEYFPDGRLMSEVHYLDGFEHGSSRAWYPSGLLQEEADMRRGITNGYARKWDEQGRLVSERICELGHTVFERAWNERGELIKDWIIGPADSQYIDLQMDRQHSGFFAFKEL